MMQKMLLDYCCLCLLSEQDEWIRGICVYNITVLQRFNVEKLVYRRLK